MFKQGLLTTLVSLLLSMTPAMADHHEQKQDSHKGMEHPAHEMGEAADVDREQPLTEEYRENLEEARDTKHDPHPAHKMGTEDTHVGTEHPADEMGDAVTSENYKNEEKSEKYKENLEEAKESEGTKHPAHEMGEGEEMLDKRGN
ncbi:MAG: hypothetical protein HUJ23_10725 [Methylophaga sp.]|nr:hypothetical protein [Methylophaga sp.]